MDKNFENDNDFTVARFEAMLESEKVFFFDAEEFMEIIEYYLDNVKFNKAQKAIVLALEQYPSNTDIKFLKVELLIIKDKLNKALDVLEDIQNIEPQNDEVYIQKAAIYSKKYDHKKAIATLKIALQFSTEKSSINSLLGMEYMFLDNLHRAKKCFIECLEEDKDDHTALHNLIYCFDFLEEHEKAIEFLNAHIEKEPYSEVVWYQLSKQYSQKKMMDEALIAIDFAIYSDDLFTGAYLEKAKILEDMKRFNEAINHYKMVLEMEDSSAFVYLRIGKCYEQLSNTNIAKTYFQKATHEDPLFDKGWMALAEVYHKSGEYKKSKNYIQKALSIDYENILYWKLSAENNLKLENLEDSAIAYQRVIELGFTDIATGCKIIDIHILLGHYEKANSFLKKFRSLYPQEAFLKIRQAVLYFKTQREEQGCKILVEILQIDPLIKEYIIHQFPYLKEYKEVKNILQVY